MPFGEHHSWEHFPLRLYRDEIEQPKKVLHRFYSRVRLSVCLEDLNDWFSAACDYGCTLRQPFSDLVNLFEDLERLLEAAWLLSQSEPTGSRDILGTSPTRMELEGRLQRIGARYADAFEDVGVWDWFPRHLDAREVMDPYLVFEALFHQNTLPAWRDEFRMIFDSAIGQFSIYETLGSSNFFSICNGIYKLVEAAFVVHILTCEHEREWAGGMDLTV